MRSFALQFTLCITQQKTFFEQLIDCVYVRSFECVNHTKEKIPRLIAQR